MLAEATQYFSLREIESEARSRLDQVIYDYFAGGACDEITLKANEAAFARMALLPRVLRGIGKPDLEISLFDYSLSMPVLIAPTAFHRLAHSEGERATARAATAAGITMIVSMASTVAVEEIAAAVTSGSPSLWFQLYIQPDLGFTEALVRSAERAGCTALVVTVDSPAFGCHERDLRNGFCDLPSGLCCENMREPGERFSSSPRKIVFSPDISWDDIEWLRKRTALKIVLKGILHPEDARQAARRGADALIVSNHGGRQLDTVPAAIEMLPEIVDAVEGKIPVIVDGGIRRGTDIVKSLALGANAVAIGRPILWGLAVAGEYGVTQVLEMLRAELDSALRLCGCASSRDLRRDLVRFRRKEESW
jgi:4-hydroxymandelate oxidase